MKYDNNNLPSNCPMKKADYSHYCPSPSRGPLTYKETGQCVKHNDCVKIVKDFKQMKVPTTTEVYKKLQ